MVEKVHHGLVQLVLDVPEDASCSAGPLPRTSRWRAVSSFSTPSQGGPALETLSWEVGHCVDYHEVFESGQLGDGAYGCHVTLAAEKLTLQPGGPGPYRPLADD